MTSVAPFPPRHAFATTSSAHMVGRKRFTAEVVTAKELRVGDKVLIDNDIEGWVYMRVTRLAPQGGAIVVHGKLYVYWYGPQYRYPDHLIVPEADELVEIVKRKGKAANG